VKFTEKTFAAARYAFIPVYFRSYVSENRRRECDKHIIPALDARSPSLLGNRGVRAVGQWYILEFELSSFL